MSKVTDTLIVMDTDKILADHGTNASDSYTPLNNGGLGYVFMVAPWLNIANQASQDQAGQQQVETFQQDEGGEKLRLALKVGDVARFRSQALVGPSSYQCFIDKILISSPGEKSITAFNPACRAIATTELDPTVPPFTQYALTRGQDYCLEATTLVSGKVQYTVNFSIYDAKLQRQGGFSFPSDLWVEDAFGATQIITASSLTSATPSVSQGTKVSFDYATPADKVNNYNWIGIYAPGTHPGYGNSVSWKYAPDIMGTLTFDTSSLAPGTYNVWYGYGNSITELAGPVVLTVTSPKAS